MLPLAAAEAYRVMGISLDYATNGRFDVSNLVSGNSASGSSGARRVPGCPDARCLTLLELWRFPGTDGLVRQSGIGGVRYIGLCPRDSARFARH
jgi:hypothetical protein